MFNKGKERIGVIEHHQDKLDNINRHFDALQYNESDQSALYSVQESGQKSNRVSLGGPQMASMSSLVVVEEEKYDHSGFHFDNQSEGNYRLETIIRKNLKQIEIYDSILKHDESSHNQSQDESLLIKNSKSLSVYKIPKDDNFKNVAASHDKANKLLMSQLDLKKGSKEKRKYWKLIGFNIENNSLLNSAVQFRTVSKQSFAA